MMVEGSTTRLNVLGAEARLSGLVSRLGPVVYTTFGTTTFR